MSLKLTKEDFIEKASIKHNNKYSYENLVYKNSRTKIDITCREHGIFRQIAGNHLAGFGCPECSGNLKLTNESFIKRSKKIHGDLYDYTNIKIINNLVKVEIICKTHGSFLQSPSAHLSGNRCPGCYGNQASDTSVFIEKSKKIHGDLYKYDKVNYINNSTKVKIGCNLHGYYDQTPHSHLQGRGCLICSGKKKFTDDKFKEISQKVHNSLYDYSKVEYVNNYTKVLIVCKKHGEFKQIPSDHMNGSGCPMCKTSKGENIIKKLLDDSSIKYKSQYSFSDLKHKRNLHFDYAILDSEEFVKCLIEYNGEQHYKYIPHFHKNGEYEESKIRDKIKKEYCKNRNIKLFIIKYSDDIKSELNKILTN